jgi:hypothetical protein
MADSANRHDLYASVGWHRPAAGHDRVECRRECRPSDAVRYLGGGKSAQQRRTLPQRRDNRPERQQIGPRRTPEGCAEGDDSVDPSGEATACDGVCDDDTAQAVSNQMYLVRAV